LLYPITFFWQVERHDLVSAYYRYLTSADKAKQLECAKAWSNWEMATSRLHEDPQLLNKTESDIWSLQFARIEWLVLSIGYCSLLLYLWSIHGLTGSVVRC